MADLQQTYSRQVKNPNSVFPPREGARTQPFCEKLMGKAVGGTETFAFDIASACARANGKRKPSVLRRRAIDALLQGMCFYYDPVSNQVHRSITELALDCGLARKNTHGHLAIERAVRAIKSQEEDFGFIVCSPSSGFYNKRCAITLTPRFFEFLGVFPLALTEARLAVLRSGYGD
ncbi:replication protein [Escherichia coli]|nr:replication protein [Escherichia coli]